MTDRQSPLDAELESWIAALERDPDAEIDTASIARLAPIFGEAHFPHLLALCHRIETVDKKVVALARLFDAHVSNGGEDDFRTAGIRKLTDAVEESIAALSEHRAATAGPGGAPPRCQIGIETINHGLNETGQRDCTLRIDVLDPRVGPYLWDRFEFSCESPVLLFAQLADLAEHVAYGFEAKVAPQPEAPLYRYHPERFRAHHGFCEWLRRFFDRQVDKRSGQPTLEQLNEITRHIVEELNSRAAAERPLRPRLISVPNPTAPVHAAVRLAVLWGRYLKSGREIFDFPPAMVDMFRETDVEDIPLGMIRMPYAAQYLFFGPQADLEIEPGWLIDGAYVERLDDEGAFTITATACPIEHSWSTHWPGEPEPYFSQDFEARHRAMDLGTAVDEVLAEKLAVYRKEVEGGPDSEDLTAEMSAAFAEQGEEFPEQIRLVNRTRYNSNERLATETHRFPVYRAALRLIVNALCYITAYADDVEAAWPEGTPEPLRLKTTAVKFKEARNARSKLEALGYVPIHFCGREFTRRSSPEPTEPGRHVAVHWRRGHWKRQPYGEGRQLRKLIWIMPVRVGKTQTGESEPPGHVYLVS